MNFENYSLMSEGLGDDLLAAMQLQLQDYQAVVCEQAATLVAREQAVETSSG